MAPRKPTQPRRSTPRKPRHQRVQQPSVPRVSVRVVDFPSPRQAATEPPRGRLGRRYDARAQARKGATHGPQLHLRPVVVARLTVLAVIVFFTLLLLAVR